MAKIPKNRQNEEYWQARDEAEQTWIKQNLANDEQFNRKLEKYYQDAITQINRDIDSQYIKLAPTTNGLRGAYQAVSEADMKAYEAEAKRVVSKAGQLKAKGKRVSYSDFSKEVNNHMRIYNATMRINRLEYLKSQVGLRLTNASMNIDSDMRLKLTDAYVDEVKRQAGILGVSAKPSIWTSPKVAKVVMAQTGGATFSERLWANQDALKAQLDQVISVGIIKGDNPRTMARALKSQLKDTVTNHRYVTERLARTESARVQFKAQMDSIKGNGYRYVKWHAEPGACKVCVEIASRDDGMGRGVYEIDDVPTIPAHPNCRCSISTYWVKGKQNLALSSDEQAALNNYISSNSYKINDDLRRNAVSSSEKQFVKHLDAALSKMPIYAENKPLQRDYFFQDNDQKRSFISQMDNGWFEDPAYVSASKIHYGQGEEQVHVIIKNSKTGRDISEYNENEQEVLFPRNTRFKVEDFYTNDNGILTVVWSE